MPPNAHFDSPERSAESAVLPRILDEFYHRARHHKLPPARKHWKSSSEKNATLRETEPTWPGELQNMERVSLDEFQAKNFRGEIPEDFFDILKKFEVFWGGVPRSGADAKLIDLDLHLDLLLGALQGAISN